MRRPRPIAAALLCLGLLALPSPAAAIWSPEGESYALDIGGSLRSIGAGMQNYDFPLLFGEDNSADGLSQTLLRLTFTGELWSFYSYEAHVVQGFNFTTSAFSALGAVGGRGAMRYRALDFAWDWADAGDYTASLGFDRLNMKLALPYVDITAGRQAINFSKTYFWNPLDVFLPFDPQSFDRDYKPGVDALKVDIAIGDYTSITLVAAAGRRIGYKLSEIGNWAVPYTPDWPRNPDTGCIMPRPEDFESVSTDLFIQQIQDDPWYGSALMLRAATNLWEWDFSLQGGKVYGGYHLGFGFSGELFTLGLRGEVAYFFADDDDKDNTARIFDPREVTMFREVDLVRDHAKVVVGIGRSFESSLDLQLEYFYNGSGGDDLDAGLLRLGLGETQSLSEHLLGATVSYELHPLVRGSLAFIFSASDMSSMLSPTIVYSIADEAEFVAGAMLAFGPRPRAHLFKLDVFGDCVDIPFAKLHSEFGTYPNIYFGEFKFYF